MLEVGLISATPMLAVTNTSPWLSASGSRKTASRRSASAIEAPWEREAGSSTTYSSPDRRATVAASGTALSRRRATVTSTSSPAAWPRESLMFLNRSRSTKNRVGWTSALHDVRNRSLMWPRSTLRLGSPVSGSVWAPWSSSARARVLARTAPNTRRVTVLARAMADRKRTMRSAPSFGLVSARTTTGTTSEPMTTNSRPRPSTFTSAWGRDRSGKLRWRNAALALK